MTSTRRVVEVYIPGSACKVGDGFCGTILAAIVRSDGVSYQVSWWEGGERHCEILEDLEVEPAPSSCYRLEVGFRDSASATDEAEGRGPQITESVRRPPSLGKSVVGTSDQTRVVEEPDPLQVSTECRCIIPTHPSLYDISWDIQNRHGEEHYQERLANVTAEQALEHMMRRTGRDEMMVLSVRKIR